jgi:DNA-binding NarL/FixJ family response regulator
MGKSPALRENRRVSRTVLVVDDHAGFRARARLLLEAEGYEVVGEAADGRTALAEAARLRPEVVLLDVQLPDLDGFDVASRLTGDGDAPAVVLTSSRDWSDSAELIVRSGARGFVPKDQLSGETLEELFR